MEMKLVVSLVDYWVVVMVVLMVALSDGKLDELKDDCWVGNWAVLRVGQKVDTWDLLMVERMDGL